MTRIILSIIATCFLVTGVQAQNVTVAQVATGLHDSNKGNQVFNTCMRHSRDKGDWDSLRITWLNLDREVCVRGAWVLSQSYHLGTHTEQTPGLAAIMRGFAILEENDPEVAAKLDWFEQRVIKGEFDDDPFGFALRAKLPQTRSAESDTCPEEDKAGNFGCLRPMVTVTTWCRHKDGYRAAVSREKCRRDPDLEVVETRSR